ncbi:MAG: tRNA lysidine(34) synthetase TilS [Candidatus Omnitrophica bacterium]|nr:tRNA lysidine(34) synthetase TilS [Candidatus Omnitrophota bacterium]
MIIEQVKKTIKRYRLIDKNDKIVVGVSGGPDSLALVYLLDRLKGGLGISLHIAHLDHMLRKDSAKDADFVKKIAKKLDIPVTAAQINVKKLAQKGSLEEIARNARLGFLFKVAKDIKAKKIALGHNLDDQAETVLMRIVRGAGLSGLAGILPKRELGGFKVIRPLIEVRRRDIEAFLKRRKIKPRRDISNLEDIYFRNRIRNKLLPLLEREYNRNIKEVLSNMAQAVAFDYDYLHQLALRSSKRMGSEASLNKFLRLHPAMQRMLLRLAIFKVKGDTRRIGFQHIKELEDLVLNRPINSIVDLPQGISAIKKKKSLSFYRRVH